MPENLRYASMEELASAHSELLTQYTDERAAGFVKRAMRTGAILETAGDRRGAQSRIDYWTTLLLRSESAKTMELTTTLLDAFDPAQVKPIPDEDCPFRAPLAPRTTSGPLTIEELTAAIEEPARRVGLRFEDGLPEALAREVAGAPDDLAMLRIALLQLWDRRDRNWIRWKAFEALGSVRAALAQTAEHVYLGLGAADRELAQPIFMRLVNVSEAGGWQARGVPRGDLRKLGDAKRVDSVLEAFTDASLFREGGVVELWPQETVRQWSRLTQWLELNRLRNRNRLLLATVVLLIVALAATCYAAWVTERLVDAQRKITSLETPRAALHAPLKVRSHRGSTGIVYYLAVDPGSIPRKNSIISITYRLEFGQSSKLILFTTAEPLPDGALPFEAFYLGRGGIPKTVTALVEFEGTGTPPLLVNCPVPENWP